MTPSNIFAIAAADDAQSCYAATDAGLWKWSASDGAWTQVAPQFAPVALTAVAASGSTILIGANGDVAVSRDDAASFGIATLPIKAQVLALAISPNFAADRIALAATMQDGVLRSTDGGATFHAWNFGLIDLHVNALLMSPAFADDATVFAATDHSVFQSTNGGRAWRELPLPPDAAPCTALALDPDGRLLVGTESAGLWSAAAPYAQFTHDDGLPAAEINALSASGRTSFAATADGVFARSSDAWQRIHETSDALSFALAGDAVFAGTADGEVIRLP